MAAVPESHQPESATGFLNFVFKHRNMNSENLKSYFTRIKFKEIEGDSTGNLQLLVKHHTRNIPFENLNPLLDIPVNLDLDSLTDKLIFGGRGGYCFEQNLLFMEVLKTLGFEAKPLAARVNSSGEIMHPRTHMLLLVKTQEAQFLTDVGFGGMTPAAPLRFETGLIQKTPHTAYRISEENGGFSLQALQDKTWRNLYEFDLQRQFPVDFEMANWYTSTFPDSHFRHRFYVARTGTDKRFGLRDKQLSIHYKNGETERKLLSSPREIKEVLTSVFDINIEPLLPRLDLKLAGMF